MTVLSLDATRGKSIKTHCQTPHPISMAPATISESALQTLSTELAQAQALLAAKNELLRAQDVVIASKDALVASQSNELTYLKSSSSTNGNYTRDARGDDTARKRQHQDTHDACSALERDEVLDHIFSFVGGGEHLYVGGVDRRWRGRYLRHCVLNGRTKRTHKFVTRHHCVLVTAARLQLALQSGLRARTINFDKKSTAIHVVKHCIEPQAVIAMARSNGAAWSVRLPACAAFVGNLPLLSWLRSHGCPWKKREVALLAARSGSVAVLQYLWTKLCAHCWSEDRVEKMFEAAGCHSQTAAAQCLLDNAAAQWPDSFITERSVHTLIAELT
jgi:hypothetical protein